MADKLTATNSKQRLSSQERREAIVQAALHLFSEKGFRGTTTRELAARVGVSEPVLYEHFRTKRDLYHAIIDRKSQEEMEFAGNMAELAEKRNDVGYFSLLARSILDWHEKDPAFVRLLLFSGLEGHELKDIFFERKNKQFFGAVQGYIETRIAEGAFRRMDPAIATESFLGMFAHHGMMQLIFNCMPDLAPKELVISNMVDLFLNGISGPGEKQK